MKRYKKRLKELPPAATEGKITGGESMSVKIGAAYIRVSTDDQLEYSPDSQLKLIREHAKREGYIVPDDYVFQDDGISGKSAEKRPAFMLMVATAKEDAPPFDCIFVWKYSRFARNMEESLVYKNLLKKQGVTVKSISEPSSDSPYSTLIERILEWMDEFYIINLATEVRRGLKEKASRGEAVGNPPFGYRVESKRLVPDENAGVVRFIFAQYAAGSGYRIIARELGRMGIRTAAGAVPSVTFVKYVLHNPAYIGKIRWSDGPADYLHPIRANKNAVLFDGKHDPLIDAELWEKVQERLMKNDAEPKYIRREDSVFMLKGIVRCSNCGSTLVRSFVRGKACLQCCKYSRSQCSVSHFILLDKANAAAISALEGILETKKFVFAPSPVRPPQITHDWDKLIAAEENRLKRAKSALLDGAFTTDEYKAVKAEIEDNISRLKAEQEASAPSQDYDPAAAEEKIRDVLNLLKSPDVSEIKKNKALLSIVEKIVFARSEKTFSVFLRKNHIF